MPSDTTAARATKGMSHADVRCAKLAARSPELIETKTSAGDVEKMPDHAPRGPITLTQIDGRNDTNTRLDSVKTAFLGTIANAICELLA